MSDTLIAAPIFMPLIVAVAVAFALRRKVRRPVLFAVTSALGLLGLQAIVAPAVAKIFFSNASSGGTMSSASLFNQTVVTSAVVVILVGVPLLLWLSRAFRIRNKGAA